MCASDIRERLGSAILVYGTMADAGANRYAAEELQKHFFRSLGKRRSDPQGFRSDVKTSCALMMSSSSAAPKAIRRSRPWRVKIGLDSSGGLFRIAASDHASETEALGVRRRRILWTRIIWSWCWPETARLKPFCSRKPRWGETQYSIFDRGREMTSGFVSFTASTPLQRVDHADCRWLSPLRWPPDISGSHRTSAAGPARAFNSLRSGSFKSAKSWAAFFFCSVALNQCAGGRTPFPFHWDTEKRQYQDPFTGARNMAKTRLIVLVEFDI